MVAIWTLYCNTTTKYRLLKSFSEICLNVSFHFRVPCNPVYPFVLSYLNFAKIYMHQYINVQSSLVNNAVVRVHDFGPHCTQGALGVLISATRELLNNSDRRPLHQVHERCRSPACLQNCLIRQRAVYGTY